MANVANLLGTVGHLGHVVVESVSTNRPDATICSVYADADGVADPTTSSVYPRDEAGFTESPAKLGRREIEATSGPGEVCLDRGERGIGVEQNLVPAQPPDYGILGRTCTDRSDLNPLRPQEGGQGQDEESHRISGNLRAHLFVGYALKGDLPTADKAARGVSTHRTRVRKVVDKYQPRGRQFGQRVHGARVKPGKRPSRPEILDKRGELMAEVVESRSTPTDETGRPRCVQTIGAASLQFCQYGPVEVVLANLEHDHAGQERRDSTGVVFARRNDQTTWCRGGPTEPGSTAAVARLPNESIDVFFGGQLGEPVIYDKDALD